MEIDYGFSSAFLFVGGVPNNPIPTLVLVLDIIIHSMISGQMKISFFVSQSLMFISSQSQSHVVLIKFNTHLRFLKTQ